MKRTYEITFRVEIRAESEREMKAAVKATLEDIYVEHGRFGEEAFTVRSKKVGLRAKRLPEKR